MQPAPTEILLSDSYLPLLDGSIDSKFILIEGRRGTGKTRGVLSALLCWALAFPGSRWLMARSTRTRLTQSVLVTLEEQVFPAFGIPVPGGAGRDNRNDYVLPNGSRLIPIGLDDLQRTQSVEVAGIYVAEGVEIDTLDVVLALAGAMRQTVPDLPVHRCIVDCNPGAPRHWLNQIAQRVPEGLRRINEPADYDRLVAFNREAPPEGKWKRMVTCHQDNPAYFDVERWEWTKQGQEYLKTLQHLQGTLRRRWLDGDWVQSEGAVYPEYDEDVHTEKPFPIPAEWPVHVYWDPGYDHPTAIIWVAVGPTGCYHIIDEIYGGGRSVEQHVRDVQAHNRANPGRNVVGYYGDPQHAFSITAQAIEPISSQFRKAMGTGMSPWPRSKDKEAMVNAVRRRLIGWPPRERPDDPPVPMLKVFNTCPNTIMEFQSWRYKRTPDGQLPPGDDQFEDRDNHAMDCVCGAVAMNLRYDRRGVRVIDPEKPDPNKRR